MAKAERKSSPFGWIALGFLVGAVATLGALLVASSIGGDTYQEGPEIRTAADTAASEALPESPVTPAASPKVVPPTLPAVVDAPPTLPENPVDAQMADDAAASGMTSRTPEQR